MKISGLSDQTLAQAARVSDLVRLQQEADEPWRKLGLDKTTFDIIVGKARLSADIERALGLESLADMQRVAAMTSSTSISEASKHLTSAAAMPQYLNEFSNARAALDEMERFKGLAGSRPDPLEFVPPPPIHMDNSYVEARRRDERKVAIAEEQLELQREANRELAASRDAETARANASDRKAGFAIRIAIWSVIGTLVTGGGAILLTVLDKL